MPDTSTEVVIASQTLGSAAATITFSSIPATYTDLRLVLNGSLSASTSLRMQFNGITVNYSSTHIDGNGSSAISGRVTGATRITLNIASIPSALKFLVTSDIFSYAGSTSKTCLNTLNFDANGSGNVSYQVGLQQSTAAITSILLFPSSGNFEIGTTATLYGIL
jgi:hypothetical protein